MNEWFLFYWLSWFLVIFLSFFMSGYRMTTFYRFLLLLLMNSVHVHLLWQEQISINLAYILLCLSSVHLIVKLPFVTYRYVNLFSMTIVYMALQIWLMLAPIWFFIHPLLMIPSIMLFLVFMVSPSLEEQVVMLLSSITFGEGLFRLLLIRYQLDWTLGSLAYFNYLLVVFLLFILYRSMRNLLRMTQKSFI